jgi:hypothetical protein
MLLAGSVFGWPLTARAQQPARVRRVGILLPYAKGDTENEAYVRAFKQELEKLGWAERRNVQFDEHWTTDDMSLVRAHATTLMASQPDVVVSLGGRVVPILMQLSTSIPVVLPGAGDPVRFGYAETMMASSDTISVDIEGVGGHAARPHFAVDTVLVGAQIVNQLQSVVSRNVDPLHAAVISICMFQAGQANFIPQHAKLRGTARSLSPKVQDFLQKRVREVVEGTARAYGANVELTYTTGYPVLVNEERKTAFAAGVAREVAGRDKVNTDCAPLMGAEDFAFMLQERPGAFIYIGKRQQRAAAQSGLRLQR